MNVLQRKRGLHEPGATMTGGVVYISAPLQEARKHDKAGRSRRARSCWDKQNVRGSRLDKWLITYVLGLVGKPSAAIDISQRYHS